jgi:hypothetical protein
VGLHSGDEVNVTTKRKPFIAGIYANNELWRGVTIKVVSGMRKGLLVHYEVKGSLLAGRGGEGNTTREIVKAHDEFSHFAISFSRSNLGSSGLVTTV